jgi:hypothetical protein
MEYHIRLLLYSKLVNIFPDIVYKLYVDHYSQWITSERVVWCTETGQSQNGRWTIEQNNLFDEWLCNRWNFAKSIVRKSIK